MIELSKIITDIREGGVGETVCRRSAAFPRELQPERRKRHFSVFSRVRRVTPLWVISALAGEMWVVPRKLELSSPCGMKVFFYACRLGICKKIFSIKENQP